MAIITPSQWTPSASESTYISSSIGSLQVDNADKPWSFSSPDNNTMRFEVRQGDVFKSSSWTDPSTSERNNVQELVGNRHSVAEEVKINYDFMIEPGAANTSRWVVLGSLKGFYAESWSAPFEVALRGEKLAITANYESSPGNLVYRDLWVSDVNITRGKWYDIKINFDWGPSGNGKIDVFLDDKQIVDYDGKVGYYNQTAYLWKTGIYRSTAPETLAVQVKNLSMETGTDLPDFVPGASMPTPIPTPAPTPVPTVPTTSTPSQTPTTTKPAVNINGTSGNDVLKGTSSNNDVIKGGAGNDILNGFGGNDTLTGGSGRDVFVFSTKLGSGNVDKITDFNVVDDTIHLNDVVFTKLKWGQLASQAFWIGSAAHDRDDRIIYNNKTGDLLYDADGTGSTAAVKFANLSAGLKLTAADFLVI